MQHKAWISVGRVNDAHGIKGEIYVALRARTADWLPKLESCRLDGASSMDFTVTTARPHKAGLVLRLQGVDDRNRAEELKGAWFMIPGDCIKAEPGEQLYLGEFLGYSVKGSEGQLLGKVVGLSSNGAQDLLVVENPRGRFEVPLVEAFLREIRQQEKELFMDLPEGLVD